MMRHKSVFYTLILSFLITFAGCSNDALDPTQIGRFDPVPVVNVILDSLGVADEAEETYAGAEEPRPEDLIDYEQDYVLGVGDTIRIYMDNAAEIRRSVEWLGLKAYGGINAPYVWVGTPEGVDSWAFFDRLLEKAHVIATPGAGFGSAGEGYIRFSAFAEPGRVKEAMERFNELQGS